MGSHVAPICAVYWPLKCAIMDLLAPWWAKPGWPMAASVGRFGPRFHFTFVFYMDLVTNDDAVGAISRFQD